MVRVEYDLICIELKWLLFNKRINRGSKFGALQTRRESFLIRKKRTQQWNKHTMGTEL